MTCASASWAARWARGGLRLGARGAGVGGAGVRRRPRARAPSAARARRAAAAGQRRRRPPPTARAGRISDAACGACRRSRARARRGRAAAAGGRRRRHAARGAGCPDRAGSGAPARRAAPSPSTTETMPMNCDVDKRERQRVDPALVVVAHDLDERAQDAVAEHPAQEHLARERPVAADQHQQRRTGTGRPAIRRSASGGPGTTTPPTATAGRVSTWCCQAGLPLRRQRIRPGKRTAQGGRARAEVAAEQEAADARDGGAEHDRRRRHVGPLQQRDAALAAAVPAGEEAADHAAVGDQAAAVDHETCVDAVELGDVGDDVEERASRRSTRPRSTCRSCPPPAGRCRPSWRASSR